MSNTTPGPGEEHIDGTEPTTDSAANEDSSLRSFVSRRERSRSVSSVKPVPTRPA